MSSLKPQLGMKLNFVTVRLVCRRNSLVKWPFQKSGPEVAIVMEMEGRGQMLN